MINNNLIHVFLNGRLIAKETFQDVVKRVGSESLVTLELLRNEGQICLENIQRLPEGIVMKEDGTLHHEFPVKYKKGN